MFSFQRTYREAYHVSCRREHSTAVSHIRSLNLGPWLPQTSPSGSLHLVVMAVITVTLSFPGLVVHFIPGLSLGLLPYLFSSPSSSSPACSGMGGQGSAAEKVYDEARLSSVHQVLPAGEGTFDFLIGTKALM